MSRSAHSTPTRSPHRGPARAHAALSALLLPLVVAHEARAQRSADAPAPTVAVAPSPVLDTERAPEGPPRAALVVGTGGAVVRPMPVSTALFITAGVTGGVTSLLLSISIVLEAANALSAGACAVRTGATVIVGGTPASCPPLTPTTGWWIASALGLGSTLALVVAGFALREPEPSRPARALAIRPWVYADHTALGVGLAGRF